ncbi:MAG TPA: sulfite exporter TauE/SafE family protein [Gaiellaceae bacterium]|nr:sulfite exporter TauE/SafE family protein [Gaiellaceae bacterium]
MSWDAFVGLVLLGLAVGAVGTLVGAGGGFLLTPVLLIVYPHDSAQTLTSISLFAVWANSTSGSIAYARQKRIDVRSGLVFGAATLPGAIGGAVAVAYVPRHAFDAVMAAALAAVAVWISVHREGRRPRPGTPRVLVDAAGTEWHYRVPVVRGAVYSLAVGFASSFLGIGGGVFHVPILVAGLGFPTHIATATSHFVLAQMSAAGVITHLVQGSYRVGHGLRRSLALGVGVAVGAQFGARASTRVSGVLIERLLAAGLVLVALRLALSA